MYLSPSTLLQGGKYKIVRFLSSGGFGNTYEGVHTMMDTRVAIKEFFPKMFCNRDENTSHVTVATQGNRELVDKLRKKFNEEAKAVFQMNHTNIVRVLDIFEENGTAYYVMEYIDGKSLNEITKERGALPEAEAVGYICQVTDALKYVHSLNRLHLDIKPGNIMIDKNGEAILIDFGASKHYDDESGENTSTLLGVNTKGYAPIEQSTQSFTSFSPATDIYALGATLYKMLTGIVPPDANLLLAEEETLQSLPNCISEPTRNAVMAAMQLRRKNRPQSVDEFVAMLDNTTEPNIQEESTKKPANIIASKKQPNTSDNESTLLDTEDKFSHDVRELCAQTGQSQAVCEKALKQTKGNKRAALIKIQTDELYKKCGNTELGIGRGTCKEYIENAGGSVEEAEKRIKTLIRKRKSDIKSLFAIYGDEDDPSGFDMKTCKEVYASSDYDKKVAEDKLLEKQYTDNIAPFIDSEPEDNFIIRIWKILTENIYSTIFYLIVFAGFVGFFAYKTEGVAVPCLFASILVGAIAFVMGLVVTWFFDEDLGFVQVSKIIYISNCVLSFLILGLCIYFHIDLPSGDNPLIKGH